MRGISVLVLLVAGILGSSRTEDFSTRIPARTKGTATYYVLGHVHGYGHAEFLVDTGATYLGLNAGIIQALKKRGEATHIKDIAGVLADGSWVKISIYRIPALTLGGCTLSDIEAAIFPGDRRNILGLNALVRAAPFGLSVDPPQLLLSNCLSSRMSDGLRSF